MILDDLIDKKIKQETNLLYDSKCIDQKQQTFCYWYCICKKLTSITLSWLPYL